MTALSRATVWLERYCGSDRPRQVLTSAESRSWACSRFGQRYPRSKGCLKSRLGHNSLD